MAVFLIINIVAAMGFILAALLVQTLPPTHAYYDPNGLLVPLFAACTWPLIIGLGEYLQTLLDDAKLKKQAAQRVRDAYHLHK